MHGGEDPVAFAQRMQRSVQDHHFGGRSSQDQRSMLIPSLRIVRLTIEQRSMVAY